MSQTNTDIHEVVREHYAKRARQSDSCCGPESASSCCDSKNVLYADELLASVPDDVASFSLGCGDPVTLAALQPGQSVLDLGSGGGLDCFLAARQVGPDGRVIGVDMTPEMIAKARASAARTGVTNVEFRQGYLENLPVDNESIDVVISNCVINLAPDKSRVFSEAYRVLKPGGKLSVSDIVTDGPLPAFVKRSLSLWAGCVAGAQDAKEYISLMQAAGFAQIQLTPTYFSQESVDEAAKELGDSVELDSTQRESLYRTIFSARITAIKPAAI